MVLAQRRDQAGQLFGKNLATGAIAVQAQNLHFRRVLQHLSAQLTFSRPDLQCPSSSTRSRHE
jgi:hypothetical protein